MVIIIELVWRSVILESHQLSFHQINHYHSQIQEISLFFLLVWVFLLWWIRWRGWNCKLYHKSIFLLSVIFKLNHLSPCDHIHEVVSGCFLCLSYWSISFHQNTVWGLCAIGDSSFVNWVKRIFVRLWRNLVGWSFRALDPNISIFLLSSAFPNHLSFQ